MSRLKRLDRKTSQVHFLPRNHVRKFASIGVAIGVTDAGARISYIKIVIGMLIITIDNISNPCTGDMSHD